VLQALQAGPQPVADFDERIVAGLALDGLVTIAGPTLSLP
jgi:hypothetical protein